MILNEFCDNYNEVETYLARAKTVYTTFRQKWRYTISVIEVSVGEATRETDLCYKVTILLYELERNK